MLLEKWKFTVWMLEKVSQNYNFNKNYMLISETILKKVVHFGKSILSHKKIHRKIKLHS